MPMTPEDGAILLEHLREIVGYGANCPACRSNNWNLEGPFCLLKAHEVGHGQSGFGAPILPVVVLVCSNCFYLQSFAWLAVKAKVLERRKGAEQNG